MPSRTISSSGGSGRRATRHATRLLFVAALSLSRSSPARADETNFRPYVVGSRAAGLGGAFTALADDGSGPFYNPGGIAFVSRSQLSVAGSVYGVVSGTYVDALTVGQGRHDFSYRNLNTFPTATAGVWKLGGDGARDRADVLSLGVFVPDAINVDARDQILSSENAVMLVNQVQTVWVGLTYARRMGRVGIGATVFGLLGTRISQLDITAVLPGDSSQFEIVSSRTDETIYGAVGALGVRWDPIDSLRLGLSVFSPSVGGGSRRAFARGAAAGAGSATGNPVVVVSNLDGLHASPSDPLRVQGGVAWTRGPFTLSGDVILLAGRDVTDDAGSAAPRHVVRNAVLNYALGAEYVFDRRFPLRAGFFTDFAASPLPVGTADNTTHIDRYGGAVSIGYRTDHTSTDLGLNVSGGSGQDLGPGQNIDLAHPRSLDTSQLLFYVFLEHRLRVLGAREER